MRIVRRTKTEEDKHNIKYRRPAQQPSTETGWSQDGYGLIFKQFSLNDNHDYEEVKDIKPSIPRKGMIASNNLITPSPQSKEELKPSTSKVASPHCTIASALLILNLASNAASHSSLRPQRRSHYAPTSISICHNLKIVVSKYLLSFIK